MDSLRLVCLNDGNFTRIDWSSSLDLTLVSQSMAGIRIWKVMNACHKYQTQEEEEEEE